MTACTQRASRARERGEAEGIYHTLSLAQNYTSHPCDEQELDEERPSDFRLKRMAARARAEQTTNQILEGRRRIVHLEALYRDAKNAPLPGNAEKRR